MTIQHHYEMTAVTERTVPMREIAMISYDDNLVFEHETLGQVLLAEQQEWAHNDNVRRELGRLAVQALRRRYGFN